jgi:sugar-specific transcriptional regulator TrmB
LLFNEQQGGLGLDAATLLRDFAFSKYESSCYLALVASHPSNGSQLSKLSGISRSRIYDVLRSLKRKKLVFEIEKGLYVPLQFEEMKKRLRSQFEANLAVLEEQLKAHLNESDYEYLLTLKGRGHVLSKAVDMIESAKQELYVRVFPETWKHLKKSLERAAERGVGIRLVSMGKMPLVYDIQVIHPDPEGIEEKIGGESFDIVADRSEALVGIFEAGKEDLSPIIWTRNRWFVIANRDSLRHDFYHYFLDKIYEDKESLTDRDKTIYEFIKRDD